jgi:hypothetical protein
VNGPQSFRQLWRDALRDCTDPRLTVELVTFAMALDRHMGPAGTTHTGVRSLAQLARCNKSTVTVRAAQLAATGWASVVEQGRGRRSTRYQATVPEGHSLRAVWPEGHPLVSGSEPDASDWFVSGSEPDTSDRVVSGSEPDTSDAGGSPLCPDSGPVVSGSGPVVSGSRAGLTPLDPVYPASSEREPRGTHEPDDESAALPRSNDDVDPDAYPELTDRLSPRIRLRRAEVPACVAELAFELDAATVAAWLDQLDPEKARWTYPSQAAAHCRAWAAVRANGSTDPMWGRPPSARLCEDLPAGEHCDGTWHWRDTGDDPAWHCPRNGS